MAELPTGTVTFLYTDTEGSTRLWEERPGAMRLAVERHFAVLRRAVEEHRGHVFRTQGDGLCAAFEAGPDALAAALAAQRRLRSDGTDVDPIGVRTAVHTGAAEVQDGDYVGACLNRVARLLAIGHGGQILLSRATYELVREAAPPGVELRDLGEHRLRDLQLPERVFQLVAPDLPSAFPPLRSLDTRPNNLPAQPTPLIGREQAAAGALGRLRRADVRLLTLTGPGGIGKTRLALQIAADALDDFEGGVFFTPLETIRDPALLAGAVAQAVGLRTGEHRPAAAAVQDYLRDKTALLVLDTFEQIVAAALQVTELLEACPRLKVLATSRVPLHVRGEHEYAVAPLVLPDRLHPPPTSAIVRCPAVAVFIERALDVDPAFAVTNENAPAVAEICHRLDGVPLAIELAAARTKLLSPREMLRRLERRLPLLTGGARDLPARQQTLRDAIGWSYDLLAPEEQALFRRLAVFLGGCTLEAAEAIGDAPGDLGIEVLDGLGRLVDSSLLRREAATEQSRFAFLETIREYAFERLVASGEADAVRTRHAAYYTALAEAAEPWFGRGQQVEWLDRLECEHGNLRGALRSLSESGDSGGALRLASTLWRFWWARGHRDEGQRWLGEVLALPGADAPAPARAEALLGAATLSASPAGRTAVPHEWARVRPLAEESLALFGALDDRAGTARALQFLGHATLGSGDFAEARALFERSLARGRDLSEPRIVAGAVFGMGLVARQTGDFAEARALLQESARLWRELGDRGNAAHALRSLGWVSNFQGDLAATRAFVEESLALFREVGDRSNVAYLLGDLGEVAVAQGDHAEARRVYQEGLALWRELGNRQALANQQNGLAYVLTEERDHATARALFEEALLIRRESGAPVRVSWSLAGFAFLAAAQGQPRRALRLAGAAAALRRAPGFRVPPSSVVRLERKLGPIRAELGQAAAEAVWAAGEAMSLEEAVAYALSDRDY
ncbi:MAG TPA: tetratricopeptide repeat protein [Chloroflexota bacterium]|jgi:predicted ATPase/class 3 adenylate cyclase